MKAKRDKKKALAAQEAAAEPSQKQDSDKGDDDFEEAVEHEVGHEEREDEEKFEEAREAPEDVQRAEEEEAEDLRKLEELCAAAPDEEDIEDVLQKEEEAVMAELAKLGAEGTAAASSGKNVESKPPDPALEPPAQSRADWEGEISKMRIVVEDGAISDEEKIRKLHDALMEIVGDMTNLDEHKALNLRRLADGTKEHERCKGETQRALQMKVKLDTSCRELQQQKTTVARENKRIGEEEQSRHTELKTKFETAIKDVQQKMDAELEVRQHFLKENDELRGKLEKFTETYEVQEKQLAEQRVTRESEMEVAQKRLEEHETMCAQSKVKSASLEKHNETLRKSQTILRAELQSVLGKFDEFHDAVTGTNTKHGDCKSEIDSLQAKLAEFEKDNVDLKACTELKNLTEEHKVAEKQRDALDRLCDNLVKENRKLQEQLKSSGSKK